MKKQYRYQCGCKRKYKTINGAIRHQLKCHKKMKEIIEHIFSVKEVKWD